MLQYLNPWIFQIYGFMKMVKIIFSYKNSCNVCKGSFLKILVPYKLVLGLVWFIYIYIVSIMFGEKFWLQSLLVKVSLLLPEKSSYMRHIETLAWRIILYFYNVVVIQYISHITFASKNRNSLTTRDWSQNFSQTWLTHL